LLYYYQGCRSWTWYFPYHFAPFASDFQDIANLEISFEKGHPFKPAELLMGVLPAASRTLLPKAFQSLMVDEDSPIIDFYPEDFQIDMNGKKMLWQGSTIK
jgi:5'-3' exoribonuclease 2